MTTFKNGPINVGPDNPQAALQMPGAPTGADPDRPTRLSDEEIAVLRERAHHEAGRFIDPHIVGAARYFHNRDWAAAIVGTRIVSTGHWPTLYLLHIAMQAEPEPPVTRTQLVRQAAAENEARLTETLRVLREQRTAERHRAEAAAWATVLRTCLVKVVVRENRHGRVRGGGRERLRHVVPVSEAVSGRHRRHLAGRALCETPARTKPLQLTDEPTGELATCQRCLAYVAQIRPQRAT
ncbi:hypothetical protein [Kitasatospora sp. NBC_01300]|uniref:hypothetical protein n=1 Tax=Kitasatospora sp. NBC_01300 TaxID=2903574 RepID=UPI002F90909B|nr:hypothetical protein OG556_40160 [Kitasatospora sp. NBC_01300]